MGYTYIFGALSSYGDNTTLRSYLTVNFFVQKAWICEVDDTIFYINVNPYDIVYYLIHVNYYHILTMHLIIPCN